MRKLILFTSAFPYGKGEQFLEDEIEFLSKKFQVFIVPFSYGGSFQKRNIPANVKTFKPLLDYKYYKYYTLKPVFNFNNIKKIISELSKVNINPNKHKLLVSAIRALIVVLNNKIVKTLLQELTEQDIIYFYWGHAAAFSIPFLKTKAKIVLRLHRGDLYEELHNNYFPFREYQLKKATAIVTISQHGYNYLINKYPFIQNKTYLFRLGVKNDPFFITPSSQDGTIRLVSVSSLKPVKRVHLIPKILKKLNYKNILWIHFGTGPLLSALKKEVSMLPANIKVLLKGHVNRNDIFSFYKQNPVDFFINVSESEGIPVSIMEAISFGIPVIATAVGGTPEIVTSSTGFLLKKNFSIDEVVNIIQQYRDFLNRRKIKTFWRNFYNAEKNYEEFTTFLLDL